MLRRILLRARRFELAVMLVVVLLLAGVTRRLSAGPMCDLCQLWYGYCVIDDGDVYCLDHCQWQWGPIPGVYCYYSMY